MRFRSGGLRQWWARLAAALLGAVLVVVVEAQVAAAAVLSAASGSGDLGQTPPALSWIELKDSRGVSIWNYELSLDRGGVTSPDKFFWASVTDASWGAYRSWVAISLWFLDWVLSFDWLATVAAPILRTGDAMQAVVARIGAVPALLTICAFVAVTWMARGRWATGIWELAMALLIASLASGVFAQPVQLVAGDNGLIMRSQQVGLELAAQLGGQGGAGSSTDVRRQMTGELVDTFVRQPTEMINFGRVLDGGNCEAVYDDAIAAGPYGLDSDIRDKVGDCDSSLGDYAAQPSSSMAIGALVFMPASLVILLLAVMLAGSVIAAAIYALFQSLKAIVTLVTGVLPGGLRGSLFRTIAETVMSMVIIGFTAVFLGVFLQVIQELFRTGSADSVPKTFMVVDILLVVGIVVYWRQKKQLRAAADRLAEWMSHRPGGASATRMPTRGGGGVGSMASRGLTMASQVSMIGARRRMGQQVSGGGGVTWNVDARRQAVGIFGAGGAGGAAPEGGLGMPAAPPGGSGGGSGSPAVGGAPTPRALGGRASRAAGSATGVLVRAGTNAALAYATGGASTVVTGTMTAAKAGRALKSARRVRLAARLASDGLGGGRPVAVPMPAGPSAAVPRRAIPMPSGQPGPAKPMPASGRRPALPPGRPARPPRPAASGASPVSGDASARGAGGSPRGAVPPPVIAARPVRPEVRGPAQETDPTTSASATRPRAAGPSRRYDRIVRDGQIILIPRDQRGTSGTAGESER